MIGKFEFEVLTILKEQFIKICGKKPFEVKTEGKFEPREQFYLERLEDNLFLPMSKSIYCQYDEGDGNELKDHMKALRSSSAMTYNIFGNDDAKIVDSNEVYHNYTVKYEKQLRTLKNSVSNKKANLDAFLYNSKIKQAYACEMK